MKPSRRLDRSTCLLLAVMYVTLLGNFVLYQMSPLPVLVHILVSTLGIHLAFTMWHEAAHKNVSDRPWLNDAVGVLAILPYMAPFYFERWLHLQHHVLLNRRDDPNSVYTDGPYWKMPLRYPRALRFARDRMRADPRTPREKLVDGMGLAAVVALYALALWRGVLVDVLLLWFVPFVLAKLIMDWYINYLPHVGLPPDRFAGTRIVDLAWFTPLVLSHNYHAVHHLWPNIPWHRYRSVFRDKLAYLRERGVPIETRLVGFSPSPHDLAGQDSLPR